MSSDIYNQSHTISTSSGDLVFSPSGSLKHGSNNILHAGDVGSSVQAFNQNLSDIASISGMSTNDVIKWSGSAFVASSEIDPVKSVDNVSLVESSNVYSVKDGGISSAKLADSSVNSEHVANGAIDAVHINASEVPTLAANNTFTGLNTVANLTANGQVSHQASSQSGYDYKKRAESQSTDATPATMLTISPDDDCLSHVKAVVSCMSDDGNVYASYELDNVYTRFGTGAPQLRSSNKTVHHETDAGLDVNLSVSSNDVILQYTGLSSTNLRWSASVQLYACPIYSA